MLYGIGIILKVAFFMSILIIASGKLCSRFRTATLAKPEKWKNGDCVPSEAVVATKARSSVECSSMCLRRFPECNSVRYDKVSKSCELLACMMLPKRENKNCMTYGINLYHDCSEILKTSPSSQSGVYPITNNDESRTWPVYCDMDTDGGGWTVFQKRQFHSVDFNRPWLDYRNGFGAMCDFWLGNELLYLLTSSGVYNLRLDMTTKTGDVYFATYGSFTINSKSDKYRLKFGDLIDSNVGNVLSAEAHARFSTKDKDYDNWSGRCANVKDAGWWFSSSCSNSCILNGPLNTFFECSTQLLSSSEMKIKRQC